MNEKPETITIQKVLKTIEDPIIGMIVGHENTHFKTGKGFLIKEAYLSDHYRALALEAFERGNKWGGSQPKRLEDWFTWFGKTKVQWFLFDTPQELFAWLAE